MYEVLSTQLELKMRIIGGGLRGRKLDFLKSRDIRPTMDKVRQALFNVIAASVPGARVLDLFSGSGAFGIEAISRGAEHVTFVENDRKCIDMIRKNLVRLGIEDRADLMNMDVLRAMESLNGIDKPFDIVILDPPYHKDLAKKALIKLGLYDIVSPINIIVVEHFKKDDLPETLDPFDDAQGQSRANPGSQQGVSRGIDFIRRYAEKRYGDTVLSFYKKENIIP